MCEDKFYMYTMLNKLSFNYSILSEYPAEIFSLYASIENCFVFHAALE